MKTAGRWFGFGTLVVTCLLAVANGDGSDWPTYRHDNAHSGFSAERLSLPLSARWVYSSPAPPRPAWAGQEGMVREGHEMVARVKFDDVFHVAVAGNRVYFGSSVDHALYCLRADDGGLEWRFTTGGPIRLAPTLWKQRVLFGSDDGYAYCLDAETGRLRWKVRPAAAADEWLLARGEMISRWPVRTGVLVEDGVAYFGAGIFPHENVYLCAVDAADGKLVWKQGGISETNAGRNELSPQGHLLAAGSRLFVPSGGSLPAIVDRLSGEILEKPTAAWRTTAGGVVGGSEALLADSQIYSFGAHHILALEQDTGSLGFGWFAGQQMVVDADAAYVTTGDAVLSLDRKTYAEASRVRHKLELEIYDLKRETAKAEEIKPQLAALAAKVAETRPLGVKWTAPSVGAAALIGTGEATIVGGEGYVAAFDSKTGRRRWQASVEGSARGLAVAAGRLWVSTTSGNIYSFASEGAAAVQAVQTAAARDPYSARPDMAMYRRAAGELLSHSGVNAGYCLVVGSGRGELAYELAKQSQLKIYAVEPDAAKATESRRMLMEAGLYGHRVTVHAVEFNEIPYANYFADLVVLARPLSDGVLDPVAEQLARHLKPCGGVVCLGGPEGAASNSLPVKTLKSWCEAMNLGAQGQIAAKGRWVTLTRGALPGAGSWTHQYGEPGNSSSSDDERVRGDLGVLWYGEPGPAVMVNRHDGAMAPLAMDGRFFVQGEKAVLAYDAYNGRCLWETADPGARRTGAKAGNNPGNLAAGDGSLFVVAENRCRRYDAATGRVLATYEMPDPIDRATHDWGYVAYRNGLLVGAALMSERVAEQASRRGNALGAVDDAVFAIDLKTGKSWTASGRNISAATIALSDDRVFFVDSTLTSRERDDLLRQDKAALEHLVGEAAAQAERRLKTADIRRATALDAKTGRQLWSKPVDVTDCSDVGIGGGRLTLMHQQGVLVLCGANANGHYWSQFIAGEFKIRRLVALSAADGQVLWAKDANYRHRPIIVGDDVIAEPWRFDLRSGQQVTRPNLLTGEPVPWSIMRTGHHCGALAGCPHMLTFRSGSTGYYDLDADFGVQHFAGQRPGCWINSIPANGLVIVPEASAGCVCLFSIESTMVLEPRPPRRSWGIASCIGATTPVEHLALNLGAPGDRRDDQGTMWLAWPRPARDKTTGLDVGLQVETKFTKQGGFRSVDSEDTLVPGAATPWIFTSWAHGITRLAVPLRGKADGPARYDIKLYFADLDGRGNVAAEFDVGIQGRKAARVRLGDGKEAPSHIVREFSAVEVGDELLVELYPGGGGPDAPMPILSAVEINRCEPD